VGGVALLGEMEGIDVDKSDKPKTDIVILGTNVFVDPYQELEAMEAEESARAAAEIEAEAQRVAAAKAAAKASATRQALAGSTASTFRVVVIGVVVELTCPFPHVAARSWKVYDRCEQGRKTAT
jgi:hypothetical protein